jgi:antitoxin MazE
METQVGKWGNSMALRIPKVLADQAGLEDGSKVELRFEDGMLLIEPISKKYNLDELTAGITDQNRPTETSWGKAKGDEVW